MCKLTVDLELQQIRRVSGTAIGSGLEARKAGVLEIESVNESVGEATGIVSGDVTINRVGKMQRLRAIKAAPDARLPGVSRESQPT